MGNNTVITIARQYGSGGREIGKQVAEKLGIPFFDKELIEMAAKKSGISEELFEKADETAANSLLYSLMMGSYNLAGAVGNPAGMPINDKLFLIQSDIIKDAAGKGSCVIVGRCGNYVLRDAPHCLHVFVHADKIARVERAIEEYGDSPENAADILMKKDKKRGNYYNFYTNKRWGDLENYNLTLDSAKLGTGSAVELICLAAQAAK